MSLKVSVIVACYNVENYISKSIQSILQQRYSNLELIVVNDGSTDNSLQILNEIAAKDNRLKIISQPNQGVSIARNNALKIAQGEYVCFVDGDDWLAPDTLEVLVQHAAYDLVCCSFYKEYENNLVVRDLMYDGCYTASDLQRRLTGPIAAELADPSHLDTFAPVWAKLFKNKIIQDNKIAFYDIRKIGSWEDGYFVWCYLNCSQNVFIINKPYYYYRKDNTSSVTSKHRENLINKIANQHNLLKEALEKYNKPEVYWQAYHNRVSMSVLGLGLNVLLRNNNILSKRKELFSILETKYIREALNQLTLKYFPVHWKTFFYAAKKKQVFILMILLQVIKKAIKK